MYNFITIEQKRNCITNFRKLQKELPEMKKIDKKAAVLIPLCFVNNSLSLLFTTRSKQLRSQGGQVCFPGGISESCDVDLKDTALRETYEELGIPKRVIDVWGCGYFLPIRSGIQVLPVIGFVQNFRMDEMKINHDEVDKAFTVSLDDLCKEDQFRYTAFENYSLPAFSVNHVDGSNTNIWGFTAILTHLFLKSFLGEKYQNKNAFKSH